MRHPVSYIVQPYDGAIAAVPDGQWDKCEAIPWL
jgi:ABC-type arginine transport system permease subunit